MTMYEVIYEKRQGHALPASVIRDTIQGYTEGRIPDYQMAALLMAVCFRGMDDTELAALTDAMVHSGQTLDLSTLGEGTVDKHSTGGVGDKTTLILAPLVAACGLTVAKMSGRGLGHTGGTVDKLESFPGYQTTLTPAAFLAQARRHGVAVIGQSGNLTPADKKLYALRDVTATVDCLPLIASSVMSKKIAAGARSIVLDVKCGSGSFMKTPADAGLLAEKMVAIGRAAGRNMAAVVTDMNRPLGRAVGNILEVQEAISVLRGEGEADLRRVCVTLAAQMIALGRRLPLSEAESLAEAALADGRAYAKFGEWIEGQGGDVSLVRHPDRFPAAPYTETVYAETAGFLSRMDTAAVGLAALALGAGRETKESAIDLSAGIWLCRKTGDFVEAGEPLAHLYTSRPERLAPAATQYRAALTFSPDAPAPTPLVYQIIS